MDSPSAPVPSPGLAADILPSARARSPARSLARFPSSLPQTSSNLLLSFSASRINAFEPSIPLRDFGSATDVHVLLPHSAPKLRISMSPRISLPIACAPLLSSPLLALLLI